MLHALLELGGRTDNLPAEIGVELCIVRNRITQRTDVQW
jgi:hypothetical protein